MPWTQPVLRKSNQNSQCVLAISSDTRLYRSRSWCCRQENPNLQCSVFDLSRQLSCVLPTSSLALAAVPQLVLQNREGIRACEENPKATSRPEQALAVWEIELKDKRHRQQNIKASGAWHDGGSGSGIGCTIAAPVPFRQYQLNRGLAAYLVGALDASHNTDTRNTFISKAIRRREYMYAPGRRARCPSCWGAGCETSPLSACSPPWSCPSPAAPAGGLRNDLWDQSRLAASVASIQCPKRPARYPNAAFVRSAASSTWPGVLSDCRSEQHMRSPV